MGYNEFFAGFKSIDLNEMRPAGFLEKITQLSKDINLKVSQKQGWKRENACPVCSSSECEKAFSKFGIDIVCCKACSLCYSAEVPANTEDIYSDNIYLPAAIESYMKNVSYRKERFGRERVELISRQIGNPHGKRLLDIGCGTGWFLEVAREYGFEVYGQELGKELAKWTNERLGVKIFSKTISEISSQIQFDVITMFDLLEHVPEPLQLISDCKRLLNKDGILLVFTPNFDSLSIHVMKEHSNLIAPAEHLTCFTKKAVEVLASKAELEVVHYQTCGIDLGDLKSYYEWLGERSLELACQQMYNLIQPLVDTSGAGNHMRFILK